jgi:site-specific recombinase XerD
MEWLEDRGISLDLVTAEIATQYLDYLVTSRHEIRPGKIGVYSPRTIMKKIAVVRSFFYFLGEGNE